MKTNLFICFCFTLTLTFAQSERSVIKYIDSINSLALNHYKNNEIAKSFNYLIETVKLSDSIKDTYGSAEANFNLGNIYNHMGLHKEAQICYAKMLEQSKKINDNFLIASSYMCFGDMYKNEKPLKIVIEYYEKALQYAVKNNVRDLNNLDKRQNISFDIRMRLCAAYIENNQTDDAYLDLLKAEKEVSDAYSKALLSYNYGQYYLKIQSFNLANNKFNEALDFIGKSITTNTDHVTNLLLSNIYKQSSIVYSKLDMTDEAYQALLKHNNVRDLFINEEKVKQEKIAKSKFFIADYKQMAEAANNDRLLQQKVTSKIRVVNIVISIAIVVLIILFIILIVNYRAKRKLSVILNEKNVQLVKARDQAEKSSELKMKFISNVTHELRTPLYGVVGLTSLMLEKNTFSEEDKKLLNSLRYSGDYLLNLVNDILQIGKMESEKVELQNMSFNLKDLINGMIGSFEYRLQENNNQIQVMFDDSIPEFIICDKVRLSQILINLIGNSVKFTENGNIWIRIINVNTHDNKINLRFEIEDNGAGIPENQHEAIFENFSQFNDNNNVNYQGTGLGLSIVKNLIHLFNSEIELESQVGKGAKFSFNVIFDVDSEGAVKDRVKKEGKLLPLNKGYKILVAEDNKINQIVTRNLLEKSNFKCDVVENGQECVKAAKENNYDLILMDINMPIMNGNEATKEIRKTFPNMPIVALTAANVEDVKNDLDAIGYDGLITKPFDNCEFFQTINTTIQKKKLEKIGIEFVRVS